MRIILYEDIGTTSLVLVYKVIKLKVCKVHQISKRGLDFYTVCNMGFACKAKKLKKKKPTTK